MNSKFVGKSPLLSLHLSVYVAILLFHSLTLGLAQAQSNDMPGSNVMVTLTGSGKLFGTFPYGNGRVDYVTNQITVGLQFHPYSPQVSGVFYNSSVADFSGWITLTTAASETQSGSSTIYNLYTTNNYDEPNYAVTSQFFGPQFSLSDGTSLSGNLAALNLLLPTGGASQNPVPYQISYDGTNGTLTVWISLPSPFGGDTTGWAIPCTASVINNGSTIQGTVKDAPTGTPLPGATAVVGGQTFVTDSKGIFFAPLTPPGKLAIQITAPGYQRFAATNPLPPFTALEVAFPLNRLPITVTPLRVSLLQANVMPSDEIDAPIVPFADDDALTSAAPLGAGVAADDVTPVIFKISGVPTNCVVQLNHDAFAYTNGSLSDRLFVLTGRSWLQTTNLSSATPDGASNVYAYMQGLRWSDFALWASNNNQVHVTLNVYSTPGGSLITNCTFLVRPPPIALVHGIADNSSTWSYLFTNDLALNVPADFIVPINYGVGSDSIRQLWPNFFMRLDELAPILDVVLQEQMEISLKRDWDFTRYDVVGHSQGGVLLRMLCQTNPAGRSAFTVTDPVVSQENFYRGRFRRVVTIGSPQNGTLLTWYLDRLQASSDGIFGIYEQAWFAALSLLSPNKFDPFGQQIQEINNSILPVDSRIKFNSIRTVISGGAPPNLIAKQNPLEYNLLGLFFPSQLSGESRGQVLLPDGADGAVDYDSEGGGKGTPTTELLSPSISHAAPEWLFGVNAGEVQTASVEVAATVRNLLSGPASRFGSFMLPNLLTDADLQNYENALAIETHIAQLLDIIRELPHPLTPATNVSFNVQIPVAFPSAGPIDWDVEVFGTNGISTNGVSFAINSNDSSIVTVSYDPDLEGQVVLFASYTATNGSMIVAKPFVVASNPAGTTLSTIEFDPQVVNMSPGEVFPTAIRGDYLNGVSTFLYVPVGTAGYSSSDTNIATVDSAGVVTMHSPGVAFITVSYGGFGAQLIVSSIAPVITAPVQNQAAALGSNAIVSVLAAGFGPLSYQWSFNGVAITGATNSVLTISNAQAGNTGTYSMLVSNLFGTAISKAVLSVGRPSALLNDGTFGFSSNHFGFDFISIPGHTVVVQTSTDLTNWIPIITNTTAVFPTYFSDPNPASGARHFYRLQLQ